MVLRKIKIKDLRKEEETALRQIRSFKVKAEVVLWLLLYSVSIAEKRNTGLETEIVKLQKGVKE